MGFWIQLKPNRRYEFIDGILLSTVGVALILRFLDDGPHRELFGRLRNGGGTKSQNALNAASQPWGDRAMWWAFTLFAAIITLFRGLSKMYENVDKSDWKSLNTRLSNVRNSISKLSRSRRD